MRFQNVIAMGAGFALDAVLGDPHGWPHPVRLIGKQIEFEESLVRACILGDQDELAKWRDRGWLGNVVRRAAASAGWPVDGPAYVAVEGGEDTAAASGESKVATSGARSGTSPLESPAWPLDRQQTERLCGIALAADVTLLAPIATWGLLKLCARFHPLLALGAESVLCYQLIAARSLRDESMRVHDALQAGDLDGARAACAMIVGRDTDALDEQGVARAAVETVAENTSDGVVAPLLFMGVGGAPAAMLYKAVNTLDSMVGYKNERYLNLGRASAKLDDLLNLVPSRVSGVLMCASAGLLGMDARRAWSTFKRDRLKHTSPNSAHTEAACAGALGVQLGGGSYYGGTYVEKPTMGDDVCAIQPDDIARANRLMYGTAVLALGVAACVGVVVGKARAR